MPSSDELYKQMQGIMDQYQSYTPVNPGDIYNELAKKVDYWKPQYQELRNTETNAYAAPTSMMKDYYSKFGGEAGTGPGAMNRLDSILHNIGSLYGTANVQRDTINAGKGRLEDLSNSALGQYNAGKQSLMEQYQMKQPLWQAAMAKEEADRARAAARAASGGGGGGYDLGSLLGGGGDGGNGGDDNDPNALLKRIQGMPDELDYKEGVAEYLKGLGGTEIESGQGYVLYSIPLPGGGFKQIRVKKPQGNFFPNAQGVFDKLINQYKNQKPVAGPSTALAPIQNMVSGLGMSLNSPHGWFQMPLTGHWNKM